MTLFLQLRGARRRTQPAWAAVAWGAAACGMVAFAAAVWVLPSGCGGPGASEQMQARIAPYLDEVARFDRWARRFSLARAAFRSEAALEEAAFAPLRDRAPVRAAWLNREGPDAHTLRYPSGAPAVPAEGWVTVQTRTLGEVTARTGPLQVGDTRFDGVWIRRSRSATGGATLHVTMAFGDIVGDDEEDDDEE